MSGANILTRSSHPIRAMICRQGNTHSASHLSVTNGSPCYWLWNFAGALLDQACKHALLPITQDLLSGVWIRLVETQLELLQYQPERSPAHILSLLPALSQVLDYTGNAAPACVLLECRSSFLHLPGCIAGDLQICHYVTRLVQEELATGSAESLEVK